MGGRERRVETRGGKGKEGHGREPWEEMAGEAKNNLTHPLSQIPGYATVATSVL